MKFTAGDAELGCDLAEADQASAVVLMVGTCNLNIRTGRSRPTTSHASAAGPQFAHRAVDETGVHSLLWLFAEGDTMGALNLHSEQAGASTTGRGRSVPYSAPVPPWPWRGAEDHQ